MLDQRVVSEEYERYIVCKEMGWDYYTFESQPPFFLEQLIIFMSYENKRVKLDQDKASRPKESAKVSRF